MSTQLDPLASDSLEFVTFSAGGQIFCLEITQIREIRRWTPVTALPHTPSDVLGVMNLRGSVIPIFDLSARFGLGHTPANERNVVIVAANGANTVGMLVESVSEILSIECDLIQDTPDLKSDSTRTYITGVIAHNETMIRVVDLNTVIGVEHA